MFSGGIERGKWYEVGLFNDLRYSEYIARHWNNGEDKQNGLLASNKESLITHILWLRHLGQSF